MLIIFPYYAVFFLSVNYITGKDERNGKNSPYFILEWFRMRFQKIKRRLILSEKWRTD